ncbi:MAG: GntR family transcriptional regulator [Pseudomonadota bacterium]
MAEHGTKATALARRIIQVIQREGLTAGARLPEVWLAERLGVSRSPVRAALAVLKSSGLVTSTAKTGTVLACDPDSTRFEAADLPEPEAEAICRDLIRARFANLVPDQVSVSDVMRRYETDRATANRVLLEMSEDGLVERSPGHFYTFGPVLNDAGAYEESYRFRLIVEPAAVLEPGFQVDLRRVERLRDRHRELLSGDTEARPVTDIFEADAAFHEAIGDFSGNRFFRQAIRLQTRLRRLSEYENYSDRNRLARSCQEHLAILDALDAGNAARAAVLLRGHIEVAQRERPDFNKVRALAHRRLTRL